MPSSRPNVRIVADLLVAVILWGASNVGAKVLMAHWPPALTGATRFLFAGLILQALLSWAGKSSPRSAMSSSASLELWYRTGAFMALYIIVFNWAVRLTAVSHVALYLGAAPVWATLWEQRGSLTRGSVQRYAAAFLAVLGVVVLFGPELMKGEPNWLGEVLGLSTGFLWAGYGFQCRKLTPRLSGAAVTAGTLWRAGVLLLVPSLFELRQFHGPINGGLVLIQVYCILGGSVAAYWLWNHALLRWPTSRVYLFNNLIPVTTMTCAHIFLDEPITPTFGLALVFIMAGVTLGQCYRPGAIAKTERDATRAFPPE